MVVNGILKLISDILVKDLEIGKYKFIIKYIDVFGKVIEFIVESINEKDLKDVKVVLEGNLKVKLIVGDDRYVIVVVIVK